jgi:hypothetical protein
VLIISIGIIIILVMSLYFQFRFPYLKEVSLIVNVDRQMSDKSVKTKHSVIRFEI